MSPHRHPHSHPRPVTFVPVGSVLPYAGRLAATDFAPGPDGDKAKQQVRANLWTAGWLFCDGSLLSKAVYFDLYGSIGDAFGATADSFNLPDLRGQFIRGVSETEAQDPDRSYRLPKSRPDYDEWMVGSTQTDTFQAHEHDYKVSKVAGVTVSEAGESVTLFQQLPDAATTGCVAAPKGTTPRTSSETRPVNVYLNYIIRFRAE